MYGWRVEVAGFRTLIQYVWKQNPEGIFWVVRTQGDGFNLMYVQPLSFQLTQARVSWSGLMTVSKKQAREVYGPADANGVALYGGSTILAELNELTDDQYRDLKVAGETIARLQQALGECL
jgi:hypothetical protein